MTQAKYNVFETSNAATNAIAMDKTKRMLLTIGPFSSQTWYPIPEGAALQSLPELPSCLDHDRWN